MDGYKHLAELLWSHLPSDIRAQMPNEYPDRWVKMAVEEIRAKAKSASKTAAAVAIAVTESEQHKSEHYRVLCQNLETRERQILNLCCIVGVEAEEELEARVEVLASRHGEAQASRDEPLNGWKALAALLWELIPDYVRFTPINEGDGDEGTTVNDHSEQWISATAEKIRDHVKTNLVLLRNRDAADFGKRVHAAIEEQHNGQRGEEHQKLADACLLFIEAMTGEGFSGYLPAWFEDHARTQSDGSEVGSLTRNASAAGYEEDQTIDHFIYLVEMFKVASFGSDELELLLRERRIMNAPDVIRLIRELYAAIIETSERDEMAAADAEFPPDAEDLGKPLIDTASTPKPSVKVIRPPRFESHEIRDRYLDEPVLFEHDTSNGPRTTRPIEDLGKPLIDTAYPPKPSITPQPPTSRGRRFESHEIREHLDYLAVPPKQPVRVIRPTHQLAGVLTNISVVGTSLVGHCVLCGSKDFTRVGIHPHAGELCFHPATRKPLEFGTIDFTTFRPCVCGIGREIGPHYHTELDTIAEWSVFEAALEKWKAKQ